MAPSAVDGAIYGSRSGRAEAAGALGVAESRLDPARSHRVRIGGLNHRAMKLLFPYVSMSEHEGERHVGLTTDASHVDCRHIIGDAIDLDERLDHAARLALALAGLRPFRLQNDAGEQVGTPYPANTAGLNAAIDDVAGLALERPISLVAGNGVRLRRWT